MESKEIKKILRSLGSIVYPVDDSEYEEIRFNSDFKNIVDYIEQLEKGLESVVAYAARLQKSDTDIKALYKYVGTELQKYELKANAFDIIQRSMNMKLFNNRELAWHYENVIISDEEAEIVKQALEAKK